MPSPYARSGVLRGSRHQAKLRPPAIQNGRTLSNRKDLSVLNPSNLPAEDLEKLSIAAALPWITIPQGAAYFADEQGHSWTPIGQNDAITWPEFAGAFRRRDLTTLESYFEMLVQNKVTCLRLMIEYCHGEHRYLERPVGVFAPNMVRLWDDIFALCEKYGLRILLTPYDTFWMWARWHKHPYNFKNCGVCEKRSQWLLSSEMRDAIKARFLFATQRWGGSGALFAWDIWNEIHPAHGGDSAEVFDDFVTDISGFLRETEMRLHGRAHPQTVSLFGPVMNGDERIAGCAFRHPALDFASIHFYESGTIDNPRNTVDAAISAGKLTRQCLAEIRDGRPFFDSEHGPIHTFKDKKITLSNAFDDEYFRHIQWAHFASGGAGGGMRWPNRHPHSLTPGMRAAQLALADFLPLIDWASFRRRNLNSEIQLSDAGTVAFGCGDETQAVVWLLRRDSLDEHGLLPKNRAAITETVEIPGLKRGRYRVTAWDTTAGRIIKTFEIDGGGESGFETPPFATDVALAVRRLS